MATKLILIITLILSFSLQATEIDYLKLASVMVRDGNYSRAKTALKKAEADLYDGDRPQFLLIKGLYSLRTKKLDDAISFLKQVDEEELTFKKKIYLSEAFYQKGDLKKALGWIKDVNPKKSSVVQLKARILFENGMIAEAFNLIDKGIEKNPAQMKLAIHYYMKLQFYKSAYEMMRKYLSKRGLASEWQKMGKILYTQGAPKLAILLMEEAALRYPNEEANLEILAGFYDHQGKKHAAVEVYRKIAYLNPKQTYIAAEYLRSLGRNQEAMVLNMSVADPKEQLSQRLSYYIEKENFDLAYTLDKSLRRHKVYEKDEIKYAMSYTFLSQGEYERSLQLLKKIKKKNLLDKSVKLIELVNECKSNKWECYGNL